ncbi:MAG: B12-binding domain-containing protein [Acholeplasmataceae bacterium]
MLETYMQTFLSLLKKEDKERAVRYAIDLLEQKELTVEQLYLELLAPTLSNFECDVEDEEVCIWKEHIRTSIIRTILEISYLSIIERRKTIERVGKTILVLTPAFEYHEIGAIMNTHLMLLQGFDARYIGANTPKDEILSALRAYEPDFIALSVSNTYNIVVTKRITEEIRRFFPDVGIILGGRAFFKQGANESLTYDYLLNSLDDLKAFKRKVVA